LLCCKVVVDVDTNRAVPPRAAFGSRCDTTTIPAMGKLAQLARVELGSEPKVRARFASRPHAHNRVLNRRGWCLDRL
jgi:hypothetical protein